VTTTTTVTITVTMTMTVTTPTGMLPESEAFAGHRALSARSPILIALFSHI
jgi:hypothetical protein